MSDNNVSKLVFSDRPGVVNTISLSTPAGPLVTRYALNQPNQHLPGLYPIGY